MTVSGVYRSRQQGQSDGVERFEEEDLRIEMKKPFCAERSYSAEPPIRQAHVGLVKIAVLFRRVRAMQRLEARDLVPVGALAETPK